MRELMLELGLKPRHVAAHFKVHRNTVTRWMNDDCPRGVALYLLELRDRVGRCRAALADAERSIQAIRDA